jgi:hypothetical protein
MRVCKTTLARVCLSQLRKSFRVNCVASTRQIASLIVTPQLARWKGTDLSDERGPINAAFARGDFAPMKSKRPTFGIAPFDLEWAGFGAGFGR